VANAGGLVRQPKKADSDAERLAALLAGIEECEQRVSKTSSAVWYNPSYKIFYKIYIRLSCVNSSNILFIQFIM